MYLGRVNAGCIALHSSDGAWTERMTLAASGDWLGGEWQSETPVRIRLNALTDACLSWHAWNTSHAIRLLTQSLAQQKQRAADLLALRTGSAENRCRHLLKLLSDAGGSHRPSVQAIPLPGLKDMARLLDLAPETTCRVMARLRAKPVARGGHLERVWTSGSPVQRFLNPT